MMNANAPLNVDCLAPAGGGKRKLRAVLRLLLSTFQVTQMLRSPAATVSVPQATLREAGLTDDLLRQWLAVGYLATRPIASPPGTSNGRPRLARPADAVVLTPRGARFVSNLLALPSGVDASGDLVGTSSGHRPCWDAQTRALSWRGQVLKQFQRPAPNQELLLAAFEESDWPARIDDPLPREQSIDSAERLRETLKSLNRSLMRPWIRFHADGSGRGITWELVTLLGSDDLHSTAAEPPHDPWTSAGRYAHDRLPDFPAALPEFATAAREGATHVPRR